MNIRALFFGGLIAIVFLLTARPAPAQAAVCSITTNTLVNQTYVTDNECESIEINGNVSTTWIGTVDLIGSGTVTVKTGRTMTMGTNSEMILGANDDLLVETGGTITHTASDPNGLKITARNATITGALSADTKGCSGSNGASSHGFGPELAQGVCTHDTSGAGRVNNGGGGGGSGGAHGGASSGGPGGGATVTAVYGNSLNPTFLGSGGGQGYYTNSYGGAGGGRITLTIQGLLQVNGSITANGGNGAPPDVGHLNGAGGGSGGSIAITAASIGGAGSISANGGNGGTGAWGGGGGGGGGRIFLAYDASTFTLSNIQATVGTGGSANGKNGTTYILNRTVDDGEGALTITSGFDFPAAGDYTRESIAVGSGAYLTCAAVGTLTVSSTAWLSLNTVTWSCASAVTNVVLGSATGLSTTGTTITFSETDHFKISAPTWTNEQTTIAIAKAGAYTTIDTSNDLSLDGFTFTGAVNQGTASALGGLLIFPNTHALSLIDTTLNTSVSSTVMTSISIDADSAIDASGRGCAGSTQTADGLGPHLTTGICTITTSGYGKAGNGGGGGGGGAAHGGTGGAANGGGGAQLTTYGSEEVPLLPGSGGGGGYYLSPAAGGNGGGRILLEASGAFTLLGELNVSGLDGLYQGSWNGGGGGSGGSVYLTGAEFIGGGSILANGGNGATGGGGGGGGRISITYSGGSTDGTTITSTGGAAGNAAGTDGTVYLLAFSVPDTSSIISPATGSYNATLNPVLTSAAYGNSPGNLAHLSSDWKVTSDSGGSTLVWSATGDTVNKVSTQVNTTNGTFTGALAGQTALAASSTYYAFVRHANSMGTAAWSSPISFSTPYAGVSSTFTLHFDDPSPAIAFDYDSDFIEINASGNGLARFRDLGGGMYGGVGLAGYSIYQELSILNNVAETFTNAQVSTTVAYASGMQSDFDDIRFTADDGVTLLDHYRVSKTDGVSALFHIEIPTLVASATTTIRMYYGNADATSASDFLSTEKKSYASDAGLRAEWLMDEGAGSTIADTSGNENSGTYTYNGSGGWLGSDSQFSTGDATKYDGSGDRITTPVSITGLTDDFSLEVWAYSDSNGSGWGWFFGESAGGLFLLGKTLGASSIHYNMDGIGSGNTAAGTFTAGSWHHVVFSHDKGMSNATKIYINGSLVATINAPAWSPTTAGNLLLGQRSNGETFTGKLDSARVYTRALSAAEALAHYQNRHYFSTDPTVTFGAARSALTFASSTISVSAGGSHPSVLSVYRMEETLAAGSVGDVTYQLSMDGSIWKYWNGSAWATASDDAAYTNTSSTINSYLPLLVSQVGSGDLYVRTLFTSNGSEPVGLDTLTFFYAPTNLSPDPPTLLGPLSLVDGSTTSTATPRFSFTLNDVDGVDTVKYQIQIDDSADFGSPIIDYTSDLAAQGERSFQVGQAAGSGSYVPGQDAATLSDGSYYWRVKAIDPVPAESSYTTANGGSIAFIVDSAVRTVEFESLSLSGGESVTATSVRIVLDTTHFEDVSVDYAVYGPSSTAEGAGADYTLASGTATIMAGQTSTTIALVIVNDQIAEPDEVIAIALSSPIFATIGTNATTTYTILDNDTAGVNLSQTTMALAEGGAADTYTLVLTSQPTSTVNIVLTVPTDLQTDATTFTFTSGNWSIPQMVTVTARQDMLQEGTHTASITHATNIPSGYAYGYSGMSGITDLDVTIADDETASIAVSATMLSVTEGQNNSFTIVLGTAPLTPVDIVLSAGSGLTATPSTVTFTSSNYSTPASVLVTATNDTIYSGNRASTLTLTVSTTATGYTSQTLSSFTVTIVDDEQAGGGAAGGGFGGGNVSPIALLPFAPQPVAPPPANVPPPPPVIVVVPDLPPPPPPAPAAPAPSPSIPQVVSILNPSDVLSLVRATQNGRDYEREGKVFTQVTQDLREMSVSATDGDKLSLANFITYGISERTYALGEGERRALVRDALQTMRTAKISPADLERLTRGIIPSYRNLEAERAQVRRAQATFRSIYGGRDPNFKDPSENLAWNTLMYRIRFPRDLAAEREGIQEFRRLFGRTPTDPFQWATVRVLGYVR